MAARPGGLVTEASETFDPAGQAGSKRHASSDPA
jgi:hypothetical protein